MFNINIHPFYILLEWTAFTFAVIFITLCIPIPYESVEKKVLVENPQDLSNKFLFSIEKAHYNYLAVQLFATINFNATANINANQVTFNVGPSSDSNMELENKSPTNDDLSNNRIEMFNIYDEVFGSIDNPEFVVTISSSSSEIKDITFTMKYSTTCGYNTYLLAAFSLVYIAFSYKNIPLIALIIAYVITFTPFTSIVHPYTFIIFMMLSSYIAIVHTNKRCTLQNFTARHLTLFSYILPALIGVFGFIQSIKGGIENGLRSPLTIFICIISYILPFLVAVYQKQKEELLIDALACFCIFCPFFTNLYFPLFMCGYSAKVKSEIIANILFFFQLTCLVLSDNLINKPQKLSDEIIDIINIESSSSDDIIEASSPLKKTKIFNLTSAIIIAIPAIIGFINLGLCYMAFDVSASIKIAS